MAKNHPWKPVIQVVFREFHNVMLVTGRRLCNAYLCAARDHEVTCYANTACDQATLGFCAQALVNGCRAPWVGVNISTWKE